LDTWADGDAGADFASAAYFDTAAGSTPERPPIRSGEDRHVTVEQFDDIGHERLYAANPWGEVVRDDQRCGHRLGGSGGQLRRWAD
jgi:hypothetical protein